jgi:asparagine synthase (glutamine-hydrolysing)
MKNKLKNGIRILIKIIRLVKRKIFLKSPEIITTVKQSSLSYLSRNALTNLYKSVSITNKLDGIIIETGVALGGSSIVIAKAKSPLKRVYFYDVFDMIPPPSDKDGKDVHDRYETIKSGNSIGLNGNMYYGYEKKLFEKVKNNFINCGIKLDDTINFVQGLYQDTLQVKESVTFAHIDCDWYDSVMICLERIVPNLVVGGRIILDDYNDWSGCKKAVDEYFSDKVISSKFKFINDEKLLIIRCKN